MNCFLAGNQPFSSLGTCEGGMLGAWQWCRGLVFRRIQVRAHKKYPSRGRGDVIQGCTQGWHFNIFKVFMYSIIFINISGIRGRSRKGGARGSRTGDKGIRRNRSSRRRAKIIRHWKDVRNRGKKERNREETCLQRTCQRLEK
jgi:hypothetical protein